MIPRRFFWVFDLVILTSAFVITYIGMVYAQPWLSSTLPASWLDALAPAPAGGQLRPPVSDLLWIFLVITLATIAFLEASGAYKPIVEQSYTRIVLTGLLAPLSGLSLVGLTIFALNSDIASRLYTFGFAAVSAAGLCLYRTALRNYYRHRRQVGYDSRNVVIIGLPSSIEWIIRYFSAHSRSGEHRLFGYLTIDPEHVLADSTLPTIPKLGEVQQLGDLLIHQPIHEVIVIHPVSGGGWIKQIIQDCDYLSITLRIIPEALLLGEWRLLRELYPYERLHLPAVALVPPLLDSEALFLKRLIDIAVSAILLVLLTPIFALVALAIKLTTPHLPVFYQWRVVGQHGVEFIGYKFTTMQPDADVVKAQLLAYNEMTGPVFKMKDDPRVTPLGRFLRTYSLNELPQLWSVLRGDMSLVGPRPAFRHELERYEFWHKRKLSIRPGITCLWQVRGRNRISRFDDWVKMDLEYIDNWSLWLDIKILFRTALTVIKGSGS